MEENSRDEIMKHGQMHHARDIGYILKDSISHISRIKKTLSSSQDRGESSTSILKWPQYTERLEKESFWFTHNDSKL